MWQNEEEGKFFSPSSLPFRMIPKIPTWAKEICEQNTKLQKFNIFSFEIFFHFPTEKLEELAGK